MQQSRASDALIAIVDDDPSVREGLQSLIRSAGWKAESFASAQEFLARRRTEAPSCLVLDLQLPGPSGLDLQKRMAEVGLETPIVFLTGHGNIPASVQAMKSGAIEFLTKPVDEQDLLKAIQEAIERDRRTRLEYQIGFRIQQMLLLDQPPADVSGLQVAALTLPSQRIDGDFYTFFEHQDHSLDVIVGDVMGKGIQAALLGAATKTHFLKVLCHLLAVCPNGKLPEPSELVMEAHAQMARQLIELDSFVTLCYARLDRDRRLLQLVDCGHTGTVLWHARTAQCEVLHGENLPLGVREDEIYQQISVAVEPGDLLVFYSDGITEARNSAGELFGLNRLKECVRCSSELHPVGVVEAIRKAIAAFSGSDRLSDDFTAVVMRPPAKTEIELRGNL